VGSWHWVGSWEYSWGNKASQLELSGAHKATCIGAWASRSHSNCCRHEEPRSACWCQATRSHSYCWRQGEPSLCAAGVLGPAFQAWAPEGQCSSTVGMGEPRLQIVGALGPTWQATRSHGSCYQLRGTKPVSSGSSGAWLLALASWGAVQWHCCQLRETKPVGLCLLLPLEQQELGVLLIQEHQFLWHFRVKVADHIERGACSSQFLCVLESRTYHQAHQVMEPGAMRRLHGQRIWSVELQVVLPIPPMVSCFSVCEFREGFASGWLWDPVGGFWHPLILFQYS
jgi:hypothetical protein